MPPTFDDRPSELDALFQNHSDAIISYEFEGTDPLIRAVNRTFETTFGYDESAVVDRPIDAVTVPNETDAQETAEDLNDAARKGEPVDVNVRRTTVSGDRYFLPSEGSRRPRWTVWVRTLH